MFLARCAAAVAAGLLLAVAVDPLRLWWCAPLGAAALSLATWRARPGPAAALGLLAGFVWFGVATAWVSRVAFAAWPGLALVEGVYIAILGVVLAVTSRVPLAALWQATLWATVETLRSSWPLGGFPWLRLAHTTPEGPLAAYLPLIGIVGTSAAVALVGGLVARAALAAWARSVLRTSIALLGVATVFAGAYLTSAFLPAWSEPEAGRAGEDLEVALVQGGIRDGGSMSTPRIVLDNHVAATQELAAQIRSGERPQPDLVVWPENASDVDPFADPGVLAAIAASLKAVGAPALTGIVVDRNDEARALGLRWKNRVQSWDATGEPGEFYDKRHGVPFGEYVPLRDLLTPIFPQLAFVPQDMRSGLRRGVIDVDRAIPEAPVGGALADLPPDSLAVGVLVCFEVADVGLARDAVADGAQLIAVPTNNATYLGTPQPAQQLAIARSTAMATHRSLLVAATNGVTALVDADGQVRVELPLDTNAVLSAAVTPRQDLVPAVAHGLLIDRVIWIVAGLGVLGGLMRTRQRSRGDAETTS